MTDKQQQFSGTKPVTDAHRFDEQRLREFLHGKLPGIDESLDVRQFKGGQSNPTYQLTAGKHRYVLRRKPPGKLLPSAHAVDREHRIISALYEASLPVPKPYLLCDDESVVGTMFYVMEHVDGVIFWQPTLPELEPQQRSEIYADMVETLARLHTFDYVGAGLTDFGKPGNYFARQIGRWSGQYRQSETQTISAMDRLIDWLPDNIPDDESDSVVHGDYRLDNLVIDVGARKVRAILDWELSTIGHPLADFTYHLMSWQSPSLEIGPGGLAGVDLAGLGIPDEASYVRRYCELTGRAAGIDNRDFYSAFNFFRIAAILQGIAGRVRDGTAASAHARKAAAAVSPLATTALGFAERAGLV